MIRRGLESNGHENFATVAGVLWRREADETVEDFHRRVQEAARARGERFVVFGSLPPMPTGQGALGRPPAVR
jgi:hypothetical protein